MSIRQPAAEKLVRQLLELRLTRLTALSDEFIATMGKMVVAFVDMDEQRQRSEDLRFNEKDNHQRDVDYLNQQVPSCNAASQREETK